MRIVQIIDSLEAGGAERMAVNYANALAEEVKFSGLISTRKEGILKNQINAKVSYLFLCKKKRIDFNAVFRLKKYLLENQIDIIHAHSSSFFIAIMVKLILPKIKIIWHDHYGISSDLQTRKSWGLKFGSFFFEGSIAVNSALKTWAKSYLYCKNVIYFPNFIDDSHNSDSKLNLQGIEGKRIICVANLRPQKNHKLVIEVAKIITKKYPDWTFHLFGKDFEDSYSQEIKNLIIDSNLDRVVFFYGTTDNVPSVLKQCDIAILSSLSEGLPLAVLEYGLYKLPVVATNVGEISKIITSDEEGLIVESNNLNQFAESILKLIENKTQRLEMGLKLNSFVQLNYSQKSIIKDYVLWLHSFTNFVSKK